MHPLLLQRSYFFFFISLLCLNVKAAPPSKLDSLKAAARTHPSDKTYFDLAMAFKAMGESDSSIVYFQKSLTLCKRDVFESTVRYNYAEAALGSGFLVLAQSQAFKALEIATENEDSVAISECYNVLGIIADDTGLSERAVDYYQKSILFNPRASSSKNNLGYFYINHGQCEKGIAIYQEVLASTKNKFRHAVAHNNIGDGYLKLKNYDSAYKHIHAAYSLNLSLHDSVGIMFDSNLLGRYYLTVNKYTLAKHYFLLSYALNKKYGEVESAWISSEFPQLYNGLLSVYYHEKKADSIIWLKDEYISFQNSQLQKQRNQESERRITLLESQFQIEKKELASKVEQARREADHEKQTARQRTWIYLSFACLISVSAVAFILLRSNHSKQRANKEISRQKEELEKLDRFRNRLLSVVTHDVRSPLNSLSGLLELFQAKAVTEAELKEMLSMMRSKITSVTGFVDDLLLWTKDQMMKHQVKPELFAMNNIISDTFQLLKPQAEIKKLHLSITCPENIMVHADREMIKIVVRNFISNAIKYCRAEGSIEVLVEATEQHVKVSVRDSGIGISRDQLPGLFNAIQESRIGTYRETGTGLGLLLCKEYIELNHGTIGAESEEGRGSTFWFTVPAANAPTINA